MGIQLVRKEYVDKSINEISNHIAYIVNRTDKYIHVLIRYENMLYDKGYVFIRANINGYLYIGMVQYSKTTAYLNDIFSNSENKITLNITRVEQSSMIRMIFQCDLHSVIALECSDKFEHATTSA